MEVPWLALCLVLPFIVLFFILAYFTLPSHPIAAAFVGFEMRTDNPIVTTSHADEMNVSFLEVIGAIAHWPKYVSWSAAISSNLVNMYPLTCDG